jgi:glycosyltransferase involved in cell wall biosynthesis
MEVVQVCPLFFPYLGGIETHVREISKRLVKLGVDIKVYTTDPSGKLPKKENIDGVEIHRFRSYAPNSMYYFSPNLFFELGKVKHAKIIHVHSFPDFPSLAAALVKDIIKKPIVFTPHYWGSSHVTGTSIWRTSVKNFYNRRLGKFTFSKFNKVVTISNFEKEILVEKFEVAEKQLRYIPNGVDTEKIKDITRKKTGVSTILYVGRLEEYKGVNFLINAFPRIKSFFPEARLVIVGKGSYKLELVSLANNLGVQDSTEFLENLSGEELMQLYLSSSLFVTLSQYEALPVALLEAMAHGLPVIATSVGGVPEVIQSGKNGFLLDYPPNEKTLINIVKPLLEDPELSNKVGSSAKQTILSKFSWDDVARNLLSLYREIIKQN